jgi:hypothetical protein
LTRIVALAAGLAAAACDCGALPVRTVRDCPAGWTRDAGACVEPASDPEQCGACGGGCASPAGGTAGCSAGRCEGACPAGQALCGGTPEAGGGTCAATCEPVWRYVTIPGLPAGASAGSIWTGERGKIYVWVNRTRPGTDRPESWLYHFDGCSWTAVLSLPDSSGGPVWGSGPADVHAAAGPRIYRFDGSAWAERTLPNSVGTDGIWSIRGAPNDVYATHNTGIIRFDGSTWRTVTGLPSRTFGPMAYVRANEIYVLECWGHTLFNGSTWTWYGGFDFCDVSQASGLRDAAGALHLYVAGNNNFSNGIKVWRFTESATGSMTGSWGCKTCAQINDTPSGSGAAIWSSAAGSFWVVGWAGDDGRIWSGRWDNWVRQLTTETRIPARGACGAPPATTCG